LLASHFDYEYMLGHKIVFVCVAKGTPQPQITWFKDGIELYAHSYLHVSMAHNKHCAVWDKDINTLLRTNHTTQHHVPKLWFLPIKLHDFVFPNTGTYQPDYTMSHSQMLVPTNQTICSHFPTTCTYHPDYILSYSQTSSPTNHATSCHFPRHWHLPSRLQQCHILKHWHLPSRLHGVTFLNSGSFPLPIL